MFIGHGESRKRMEIMELSDMIIVEVIDFQFSRALTAFCVLQDYPFVALWQLNTVQDILVVYYDLYPHSLVLQQHLLGVSCCLSLDYCPFQQYSLPVFPVQYANNVGFFSCNKFAFSPIAIFDIDCFGAPRRSCCAQILLAVFVQCL